MSHLADDELLLYHYREVDDLEWIEQHLQSCTECQSRLSAIKDVLDLVVAPPLPERGPDYGSEVWARIRAELPEPPVRAHWWQAMPMWSWAAAAVVLLIGVFLLGRYTSRKPYQEASNNSPTTTQPAQQVRERVLLVAVGEHLDRSQMLLLELSHASDPGEIDLSEGRQRALELATANRLYRTTAQTAGDAMLVSLLDELERLLLQVGHQPDRLTAGDLKSIQNSIHAQGLLFKVRVVRANVRKDAVQRPRTDLNSKKGQTI